MNLFTISGSPTLDNTMLITAPGRMEAVQRMEAIIVKEYPMAKDRLRAVAKGDAHLRRFIEGETNYATWGGFFRLQAVELPKGK